MIGLFGLYKRDSSAPTDLTPLMKRHRDGYQLHAMQGGVGAAVGRAAHRVDSARGLASADGVSVITLGDIYNSEAFSPQPQGSANDPAFVILNLYLNSNLDRLAEANGQFCAAIYDSNHHRLTLITDRHVLFPIHVWRQNGEVVFASLIYILLGDERVPRKAAPETIAQLFTMQRTIGRVTSVAGVEALPAACIWQIDRNGVRERQYWHLTWRKPSFTETECADALDNAFRKAVARMANGKRTGLLLSGGIDSRWVLGAAPKGSLSCWTTASFAGNPELKLAQKIAKICGAEHHDVIVEPEETLAVHDNTVIESNGLYPASPQFSAFMPRVAAECDTVLSGHGLDYTLRGYYLPARFLDIVGSHTRLPVLRRIPARPTGADVFYNLRQGPPMATLRRIIIPAWRELWWRSQEEAMQQVLDPWLSSDDPYNAWDAFILHAVSKHYAFTGMMSVRAATNLQLPSFDAGVIDIYLQMKPEWRCSGRTVLRALRRTSPELAKLPNANTHFPADREPWIDVASLLVRGGLRRLGILSSPSVPSSMHSTGSWQAVGLYRDGPQHRARFLEIRDRLDSLSFGIISADAMKTCLDEHLEGKQSHPKFLRQLLTHDAWVRQFGINTHA